MEFRGVASSALHNKSMYQQSLMVNAIAQYMVSRGVNCNDTDAISAFNDNVANMFESNRVQAFYIRIEDDTPIGTILATYRDNPSKTLLKFGIAAEEWRDFSCTATRHNSLYLSEGGTYKATVSFNNGQIRLDTIHTSFVFAYFIILILEMSN